MRIDYTNGYYEGEVNYNNEHHGKGKFIYKSGDKYIGEYRNNKMWGKGTYYFSDGTIYEGEWVDNAREGHGKVSYPDGSYYEGEWKNNQRNGYGKEVNRNGQYEGYFKFDEVRGEGKLTLISGDIIEGNFYTLRNASNATLTKNGKKYKGKVVDTEFIEDPLNGYHEVRYTNGVYEGDYKDNVRHGVGTYTWDDGSIYEGEWKDDERTGFGNLKTENFTYSGLFKNGKYNGVGTIEFKNGNKFYGYWINDGNADNVIATINGIEYKGIIIEGNFKKVEEKIENKKIIEGLVKKRMEYTNGYYEGETLDDKKYGYGVFIWNNGYKYEGEWENDVMHGKGKLLFPDGRVFEGTFKNGNKVKGKETYDWGYYEGEFKDDAWYGDGKVTNNDGSYYSGYFEDEYNVIGVVYVDKEGEMIFGEIVDGEFYEL